MPAWLALTGVVVSATLAFLSYLGVREAQRTGHARFLFWRLRNWGVRDQSPRFFKFVVFCDWYRTGFLALSTLVFAAFLGEALGSA